MSNQTQPQTIKVDLPSPPPSVPELLASVRQATEDLKAKEHYPGRKLGNGMIEFSIRQ